MKTFIIDDDPVSNFLLQSFLLREDSDLDITTFLNAEDALEKISLNGIPDLIFLDLDMPVMDGWDFLGALPALLPNLGQIPFICILTSSLRESDAARAREIPLVSGFLHKPIRRENLKGILTGQLKSG